MATFGVNLRCTALAPSSNSGSVQCKRHATTCRHTGAAPSWSRMQISGRPSPACRAEQRSRDSTKTSEAEKLKVPDTPPTKGNASRTADEASTSQTTEISEELKMLQQRKREQIQLAAPTGYVQSIVQEVRLIEWPRPKQALTNTVLVIAMVGASSVILFAINSILAELGKWYYVYAPHAGS